MKNKIKDKVKVTSARIVVTGNKNKPYFQIEYVQASDGECYLGYSSYFINFVFDWLDECFEFVKDAQLESEVWEK
jgi:hypothetical protein